MRACIIEHHPYDSSLRTGSHHVAALLRRAGHSVTWVAHPRSALHVAAGRSRVRAQRHGDGVLEACPRLALPYVAAPGLGSLWWGRRWLDHEIGPSSIEELGRQPFDLVWLSDFTMVPILERLSFDRLVFRFFDRLDAFAWMPSSVWDLVHEHLGRADDVIASSRPVQRELEDRGIRSRYVPNGADVSGLAPPRRPVSDRPVRVAYAGAFRSWLDVAAVRYWASSCPDVEFLMIGPSRDRPWRGLPNVRVVGPVGRDRLFELLRDVRLGLIPFVLSPLTVGAHPLKQYDYLAAGCPVLSSDLPEVISRDDAVRKYDSPAEGLELLRVMISRDWDGKRLFELATANRWEVRLAPVFAELGMEGALDVE